MSKIETTPSRALLDALTKSHGVLRPQTFTVACHLAKTGTITRAEAETVHKVRNIAGNIKELRDLGVNIVTDFKNDASGQRYGRYVVKA